MEVAQYFYPLLQRRQVEPQNDLISALARAHIEEEKLSDIEVIGFCLLLLAAGYETTTALLSNAVRALIEHPEALAQIMEDPELIPGAIEETLRLYTPVERMWRSASQDIAVRQGLSPWRNEKADGPFYLTVPYGVDAPEMIPAGQEFVA